MTGMTLETRTRAVEALRTTTAKQVCGYMGNGVDVGCANGVIAAAFSIVSDRYRALERLGLRVEFIYRRNDHGWTFAQIADWLEQQPVIDPIPDNVPADWVAEGQVVS